MAAERSRLNPYRAKRNFSRTTEPAGKISRAHSLDFVVQKHAARRLHFDFRLEWRGVLLSWAVTKEPSLDPSVKRLAVRTEDHPVSYKTFEGTIPSGEYGAGTVELWDVGQWEPINDTAEGLKQGKLHFHLHGKRMQGDWTLVRMEKKDTTRKTQESWLLIKNRYAQDQDMQNNRTRKQKIIPDANHEEMLPREHESRSEIDKIKKSKPPGPSGTPPVFQKPQLALLSEFPPAGNEWLHEIKFDGYRCLMAIAGDKIHCYTRSGHDWSHKFHGIPQAAAALDCASALLDGEIVVPWDKSYSSSFSALQEALTEGGLLEYVIFDLLQLNGKNIQSRPLHERKSILRALLQSVPEDSPLKYSEHVQGNGDQVFRAICRVGGEGIVSKNATSKYASSQRNKDWQKIKCTRRQEFIVGGYSPSNKKGRSFASLLVGLFQGDKFRYRGRVGTGFSEKDLNLLADKLKSVAANKSPFDAVPASVARHARWVNPQLVIKWILPNLLHRAISVMVHFRPS